MKKFLLGLAIFVVVLFAVVKIRHDEYIFKGLWATYLHGENSATIDDAKYFDTHEIATGSEVWEWPVHADYNKQPLSEELKKMLESTKTSAFVVIHNDSLLAENYWENYSDSSQTNSFSMAKSITTMLAQIAIQKGILQNWHQKVNTLLPELKGEHASELELWHLSTMSSGLDWDESYKNPFSITAKAYYGSDINRLMLTLAIKDKPGTFYNYQSGSTQLLGMCVMKATGKSLAELASEWLWKPMQAKRAAKWHTDSEGTEMAYCCFNSNARDFARFGKMMLHHGSFNGTQILDSTFTSLATSPALAPYYGYSFWLDNSHGTKVFYQRGILGQYIITLPEYNTVIVRLGKVRMGVEDDNHSTDYHTIIDEVLKLVK